MYWEDFCCQGGFYERGRRVRSERRPCENPAQQGRHTLQNLWDYGLVSDHQWNSQLKNILGVNNAYSHEYFHNLPSSLQTKNGRIAADKGIICWFWRICSLKSAQRFSLGVLSIHRDVFWLSRKEILYYTVIWTTLKHFSISSMVWHSKTMGLGEKGGCF